MVRDTGLHQSFSVLGLMLIIVPGGIIIVLGMVTSTLVGQLQTGKKNEYRHIQWVLEEKLQLQRAAYEGVGVDVASEKRLEVVPRTDDVGSPVPPSSDVFLVDNVRKRTAGSEGTDEGVEYGSVSSRRMVMVL
jgi:hypothetical protein